VEQPGTGAIVLSGGTAVRLDGADKAALELGGRTLLERALAAVAGLGEVVVVGDEVPTSVPVTFRREDPTGGGPAAALLAGLGGFPVVPARVAVLAVDMPLVGPGTFARLLAAASADGALLVDADARRQPLCAVYATAALLAARPEPGGEVGLPLRRLVAGLSLTEVDAVGNEARDVDTWDDVRALREALAAEPDQ
jgi:molybdopterin-guanine dinucleotide biosynthesis protein A